MVYLVLKHRKEEKGKHIKYPFATMKA